MSLNNIAFDHIKDSFYYGDFGEFRIVVDKTTGFFNATKLCNQGNKKYYSWYRLEKTKSLIKYIVNSDLNTFCSVNCRTKNNDPIYEVTQGNNCEISKQVSGTYVSKELILDIASWISPEFYLKCNRIIIAHFEKEYQKTIKEKDDKIDILIKKTDELLMKNDNLIKNNDDLMKELKSVNGNLEEAREQLDEMQEELQGVNGKLDKSLENRNLDPKDLGLSHNFILFKNKEQDSEYMFVRGQDRHIKNRKNQFKSEFEITIDKTKTPNPIDLVNRLKERIQEINEKAYATALKDLKCSDEYLDASPSEKRTLVTREKKLKSKIIYRVNKIILQDFSESDLLKLVKQLDQEKYDI